MKRKNFIMITLILFIFALPFCKKQVIKNEPTSNNVIQNSENAKLDKFFKECTPESKNADFCIEVYEPVCGWFTEKPSDCNDIYCRESYANQCFACKDKRVIGYTKGNCQR
ncbi:MAG: hypothetical protein KatS3mg129_2993 [Leptospiraceae bacterium]|nr:MAG: hypothetical protein KatS3mg129_2993 [Leptospiraceae bacterium]